MTMAVIANGQILNAKLNKKKPGSFLFFQSWKDFTIVVNTQPYQTMKLALIVRVLLTRFHSVRSSVFLYQASRNASTKLTDEI